MFQSLVKENILRLKRVYLCVAANLDVWSSTDYKRKSRNKAGVRAGHASRGNTCDDVRVVPSSLNDLYKCELWQGFYKKYTEAYGIPILGNDWILFLNQNNYLVAMQFAIKGCTPPFKITDIFVFSLISLQLSNEILYYHWIP